MDIILVFETRGAGSIPARRANRTKYNDTLEGASMSILALDISGIPRQWISHDDAITYHAKNAVAWSLGETEAKYRGGTQNDGMDSYLETTSIIAIKGHGFDPFKHGKVAPNINT